MAARTVGLGATTALGVVTMYVEGFLLEGGVTQWPHLVLLTAGGVIGLGIAAVAAIRLARALGPGR